MSATSSASPASSAGGDNGLGPLTEQFRPRRWAKWLTIVFFGPLGLAGLVGASVIGIGILFLPDVPLPLALPLAGLGVVLACIGAWVVWRSWMWLGHWVEIRHEGIARHWSGRTTVRRWDEIAEVREWMVEIKGREMPHLTVRFQDGSKWEFDDEYLGYYRLAKLIHSRGRP